MGKRLEARGRTAGAAVRQWVKLLVIAIRCPTALKTMRSNSGTIIIVRKSQDAAAVRVQAA
jgi:hypothetical protein